MTREEFAQRRWKLRQWIAEQDRQRGRPLSDAEKLANLRRFLEDDDLTTSPSPGN